jgi:hypothetical protein
MAGRNKTYRVLLLFLVSNYPPMHPYIGQPVDATDTFFDDPFRVIDFPAPDLTPYDPVVAPGANEGSSSSTSFVDDPFQFTLDPRAEYHPVYNPYPISYGSGSLDDPFPPPYTPIFPPPIVSVDGTSTLAPNSEDITPLRVPQPLDSLPLGDSFLSDPLNDRAPSPPPRASGSRSRQAPEKALQFKFWPYPRTTRPKLRGLASAQVGDYHDYL